MNRFIQKFRKYYPKEYWSRRSNPNNREGELIYKSIHIEYIKPYVKELDKCFELGPGVGRTLEAYSRGTKIEAVDITNNYENKIKLKAKELNLKLNLNVLQSTEETFPFDDNEFVVGVTSQVLLHVTPESIDHYLKECLRVCNKLIVITAYSHNQKKNLSNHVFNHNYFEICTKLGLKMDDVKWCDNQLYFTLTNDPIAFIQDAN